MLGSGELLGEKDDNGRWQIPAHTMDRDRGREPVIGALARPRLGHLPSGASDPSRRASDPCPLLGSDRDKTQRAGAAGQSGLGELARPHKTPDRHSSSDLWRRIGAVGPVKWLTVVNVGKGTPSIQKTGAPTRD